VTTRMPDLTNRDTWLPISEQKPIPPYTLDPTLTFYCPQENVEAFEHPDVRAFHTYMRGEYRPPSVVGERVALLLPCTKTKPYALSKEHLEINHYLLKQGFLPHGDADYPTALLDALPDGYPPEALHNGLLEREGLFVHRMVLSEPMGLVPYEHIYTWRGKLSLAARYDDPGLFEHRGTAVGLWRDDHTAVPTSGGKYRWGSAERAAYAEAHNFLSEHVAAVLKRLQPDYRRIVGYVSPKLTHRSFLTDEAEKAANSLPRFKQTGQGRVKLVGVNDHQPGLVDVVPSGEEWQSVRQALDKRLSKQPHMTPSRVRAYFASGGGGVTPLILPESLAVLERHLTAQT